MANYLQSPGPVTLLAATGTTISTGDWYQIHPHLGRFTFQARVNASSAGATVGCTVVIDVSNDGTYVVPALTIALTNTTTDHAVNGGTLPTSFNGYWTYIRARLASCTTSTAGSAGSPVVNVVTNGAYL